LKEFVKSLALSLIAACPLAWITMSKWLDGYAYRIDLGVSTLVLACIIATITVLFAISIQLIKASQANPVDTLKYE